MRQLVDVWSFDEDDVHLPAAFARLSSPQFHSLALNVSSRLDLGPHKNHDPSAGTSAVTHGITRRA